MEAQIPCVWCGFNNRAIGQTAGCYENSEAAGVLHKDILWGVLTCGGCGERSVFQLKDGYGLGYLPGKLFQEAVAPGVADNAKEMIGEARLSF